MRLLIGLVDGKVELFTCPKIPKDPKGEKDNHIEDFGENGRHVRPRCKGENVIEMDTTILEVPPFEDISPRSHIALCVNFHHIAYNLN